MQIWRESKDIHNAQMDIRMDVPKPKPDGTLAGSGLKMEGNYQNIFAALVVIIPIFS